MFFSSPDNFNELTFEISNVGETLAIITAGFIALEFVSDPRQFKWAEGRSLSPLDANGFKNGQLRPFGIRPTDEIQKKLAVLSKTADDPFARLAEQTYGDASLVTRFPLYFFGMIYYTDGRGEEFGATRVTVFRREWVPSSGSFRRTDDLDHEYAD